MFNYPFPIQTTVWPAATNKTITVIANETDTVQTFIKQNNTNIDFQEMALTFSYNKGNIWQAITSLALGEYIIKVSATGKADTYIGVTVIPIEQYDLTVLQNQTLQAINVNNSWKVVG